MCAHHVTQELEIDGDPDDVWQVISDEALLSEWLAERVSLDVRPGAAGHVVDHDGTTRDVLVTAVEPGRRVEWLWWNERDGLSTVELVIERGERAGTSTVRVVETLEAASPTDASACTRRWQRATTRLWSRVGLVGAR